MGRVGACGDNAAIESVFAHGQKYILTRQLWQTREELRVAIVIERTYRCRGQRRFGPLAPIAFEMSYIVAHAE